jgi:general secretion pathway protein D
MVPHIVRRQELTDLNKRAFDVGTGSGIDLHIAAKQAVKPEVAQPASVTPQPAAVTPVSPRPMPTPAATQPAPTTTQPSATRTPGQVTLKLEPSTLTPQLGATFTLNVQLGNGQDISSVLTQISYDARVLQFANVSAGDYLSKDGQTVALVHRDDPSAGKLQITAQRPPGAGGVNGDGTVFTLVFTAKAKGSGAVSIAIPGARNSQNQPLEVSGSQASVTVN